MNLTPEQYKQAMASAVKMVEANVGKIMLNGANLGSALMQQRVFNKGITTSGKNMMYRSAQYIKLRTDAGLQVAHKDLIFTGNLFNSLTILGSNNKEVNYGFNNSEMAEIANYQETSDKQVNQPIFDLSKKEISQVERAMTKDVARMVVATIESYPNPPGTGVLKMAGEDAISKSQRRNRIKQQKRKAYARKQKRKEDIKAGKVFKPRLSKVDSRDKAIAQAKKKKSDLNIRATSILQKREKAKAELKRNEFTRKNLKLQQSRISKYIKVRQDRLAVATSKLSKTRSGSKNNQNAIARVQRLQKEISTANRKLNDISKVKSAKKTIAQSKSPIKRIRAQSATQTKAIKDKSVGLRELRRIQRAKRIRQGTHKPKKRKKP
jgi:hypothetical protein